ncbi:MAG: BON domain-containing protein [Polaromonas sp.]
MKNEPSDRLSARQRFKTPLVVLGSLALVLALSACGKKDDDKTAGQKLDSGISKTQQAAEEAKAKTESSAASAGAALKDATQSAESSAKELASKAAETLDDVAITAAVSAGLAKDPDLSAIKIDVDTKNGAVTLNGSAPTEAAREKASSIARAVKGVNSVENKLVLKAG